MRPSAAVNVDFVLQEHFSLLTFTAAADALTTANLISARKHFRLRTLSLSPDQVLSDIGVRFTTDHLIEDRQTDYESGTDHIVLVCGGYRCDLDANPVLCRFLRERHQRGCALGGLWNGIFALAHAGLLGGYDCTVHPDSHARAQRELPGLQLRPDNLVIDRERLSATGPGSAFELMLMLIGRELGSTTVQGIRRLLKADASSSQQRYPSPGTEPGPNTGQESASTNSSIEQGRLPESLQRVLQLMRNHLDIPVGRDQLAQHMNLSARAMERLFQRHLHTSPARYYLQMRLERAHDHLLQGDMSIGKISDMCGFASQAHFSRAFQRRYGVPPSAVRRAHTTLLDL